MYQGSYSLKGATIATRTASKWGGAMIKLDYLLVCYIQSSILT